MEKVQLSNLIKRKALDLGFDLCGITDANELREEKEHLETWLSNSYNSEMKYMENNFEKRLNPSLLVENTKSVVVVGLNYYSDIVEKSEDKPIFSKYSYGIDYHFVIKDRLDKLFRYIKELRPDAEARWFTDSAPLLERKLAKKAGLGWIGKNSMLINKEFGSFIFLGELLLNIELDYDAEFEKSYCGNCHACIDNCPNSAIVDNHIIDANKCISYLNIENKADIPHEFKENIGDRIFGCDTCQDVCPWNRNLENNIQAEFECREEIKKYTYSDWHRISTHEFSAIFKSSPVKRIKFKGFKRNLDYITKK
ncbi:MAG: tRNA epoxyqueuosine(34) reductase QueG [Marinifilaceae bacterium]|jgi:epoxyqueuosine reductase|nr:tRNA epoxyqueuosine(34) reductase QueG [Marinifilaceae bacterium]